MLLFLFFFFSGHPARLLVRGRGQDADTAVRVRGLAPPSRGGADLGQGKRVTRVKRLISFPKYFLSIILGLHFLQ